MIQELLKALMLIFVAEMGDKTQILAMAFATRFKVKKVLLGIGIGSLLNHGLAVLLGNMLTRIVPINTIQMIAGMAFVVFSLWTLKSDDYDDDDEVKIKFGPTTTVAIAFFLGELGDKTQLTAVTLAVDANYPIMILMGTVAGMIVTGGIGIFIGKKLGDRIPEIAIKIIASSVFMIFGLQKLYTTVPKELLQPIYVIPFTIFLGAVMIMMLYILFAKRKEGILSDYNMKSKILHDYYEHIQRDLELLCEIVDEESESNENSKPQELAIKVEEQLNRLTELRMRFKRLNRVNASFSIEQVLDSLVDTLWVIDHVKDSKRLNYAQQIRRELERILFDTVCPEYISIDDYVQYIKTQDIEISKRILKLYRLRMPVEKRIVNLGNQSNNMYLIEIHEGYIMIDTGLKSQYSKFSSELSNHGIGLEEIKYVFITHAHKDHVGFLKDIIRDTAAKIILHPHAVNKLKVGENSFEGGFSNFFAWVLFRTKKAVFKKTHRFDMIHDESRFIIASESNQEMLKELTSAQILDLPGHTKDSIGLILEDEVLFCGDAAVNNITGQYRIIHWIESVIDYKESWVKMINSDFSMVYPTHGKPFSKNELIKYECKVKNIKLR